MRDIKRTTMLTAGLLGLALSTAACTGTDSTTTSAAPATSAGAATSSPTPATTTSRPAPEDDGDDGSGSGGQTAGCKTADLKITDEGDEGGGSAGHHSEFLIFENITGKACSLEGYPGVSFVTGDNGEQVGKSFQRTPADSPLIMLTPGDRVHATIEIANPQAVDEKTCKPVQVRGYRIYPPDETAAAFVSKPQTACSAGDFAVGQVKPIAPTTSDS
ncbi:DUF4232 domain-containing protein [Actinoplanes sp. RD1]|uniref:DUF4232 domain-containing protein n=1 Tax=Actinoplanes sp. RD1 TaxID=3064538 RepID=UPI0027417FC3|nr:DUF4232 domain-containing protein [Actinoplanes sp. RD1]